MWRFWRTASFKVCTTCTEDGSFHTVSFWPVWKLFLCFLPRSPDYSVFSMLTKPSSFYSCKTYLSVFKILKQPHVLNVHFNLATKITHPVVSVSYWCFLWSIVLSSPIVTSPLETHSQVHWSRNYSVYACHIFVKIANDVTNHTVRVRDAASEWWSEEKLWDPHLHSNIQLRTYD